MKISQIGKNINQLNNKDNQYFQVYLVNNYQKKLIIEVKLRRQIKIQYYHKRNHRKNKIIDLILNYIKNGFYKNVKTYR